MILGGGVEVGGALGLVRFLSGAVSQLTLVIAIGCCKVLY